MCAPGKLKASHDQLAVTLTVLLLVLAVTNAQEDYLQWHQVANETALCSDHTRAGFFLNLNSSVPSSAKWVIFLESGSLCFSNDTCNRRFFVDSVRSQFSNGPSSFPTYGDFDPQTVWDATVNNSNPIPPVNVINPIMSSVQCFSNSTRYFPNGFQVSGRDILNRDPQLNKLFPHHNHVIIPYCSSDVWLGEDMDGPPCDCFDFNCFNYVPNSPNLQFTFRGKTIFQSVIRQLISDHGLGGATEVVLAGSSAGGVGVANHAQWVREQISVDASLLVIMDSSWFINFQDSIFRTFDGAVSQAQSLAQGQGGNRLLEIIQSHPPCSDYYLEYPCCLTPHCLLTRTDNKTGSPLYFPSNARIFAISSIYDIFLLAPSAEQIYGESLQRARTAPRNIGSTQSAEELVGSDFVLNFLRLAGEYGGVMNATLIDTANRVPDFSFYLPQCLQHIYLATSTLWGITGASLFGDAGVEIALGVAQFSHTLVSGRWTSNLLAVTPPQVNVTAMEYTIQDALHEWYLRMNTSTSRPYQYRAQCQGPYCYNVCPDNIGPSLLAANSWSIGAKIVICLLILALSVLSLTVKLAFVIWLRYLERKQDVYLSTLDEDIETGHSLLEFPHCEEEDAVSVSCLDIHYYVTYRAKAAKIDEKLSDVEPLVLETVIEDVQSSSDDDDDAFENSIGLGRKLSRKISSAIPDVFTFPQSFKSESRRQTRTNRRNSRRPSNTSYTSLSEPATNIQHYPRKSKRRSRRHPVPSVSSVDKEQPVDVLGATNSEAGVTRDLKTKSNKKEILNGISLYFNPGEMVGIMGPSGSGKTTFLDLITARRKTGTITGDIFVNGIPLDEIRDWYVASTGYVLQLATPYYEELTVRENVTLATMMKLPNTFSLREKFQRAEQIMEVTGLSTLADIVVGGTTGPGLSGGQKRRLAIALQLIKLPSILFLDEPTSGLDATSSFELLTHLNKLALSNRTVILTIHQPRLEIFHMFNRLVLLTEGQVAYHGAPEKAYEVFVNALTTSCFEQGLIIPELENHNPADVIMDMLGNHKMQGILTEQYEMSNEPHLVKTAIISARHKWEEHSASPIEDAKTSPSTRACPNLCSSTQPDIFTRMATHESRGAKSNRIVVFLPITFFAFGFVLGTVYLQQTTPLLIISGVSVFTAASGVFMFAAMYPFYTKALEVYSYEKADGVGRAVDLVLQGFIRYQAQAVIPVIISATVHYLLLVNAASYNFLAFLQVVVVNIALNQAWTALYIMLIVALPKGSFKVSSAVASVFSFTSGFYIPVEQLGWWLRWLVYINPNYYAASSVAVFLLSDFQTNCVGSDLACFLQSGVYLLRQFNFDQVNPYIHFLVILGFTLLYILLAILFHWLRYTTVDSKIRIYLNRKKHFGSTNDLLGPQALGKGSHLETTLEPQAQGKRGSGVEQMSLEEFGESATPVTPKTKARRNWRYAADYIIGRETESSLYLKSGESHSVWTPAGHAPKLAYIVSAVMKKDKQVREPTRVTTKSPGAQKSPTPKEILLARQGDVLNRVHATRTTLRRLSSQLEDGGSESTPAHFPLADVSNKITASEHSLTKMHPPTSPLKTAKTVLLPVKEYREEEEQHAYGRDQPEEKDIKESVQGSATSTSI